MTPAKNVCGAIFGSTVPRYRNNTPKNVHHRPSSSSPYVSASASAALTLAGSAKPPPAYASSKTLFRRFVDLGVARDPDLDPPRVDDVGDAARAIRRLADALERDPDMLLKGRAELSP